MINHRVVYLGHVLLYYKFITQFANERSFKIGELLAKLQAKWLIVSYAHWHYSFVLIR